MQNNREDFKKFLDENEVPQFNKEGYYAESSKDTYLNKLTKFPQLKYDVFSITNVEEIKKIIYDINSGVLEQESRSNRITALKIYEVFLKSKDIYSFVDDDIADIQNENISDTDKKRLVNSRLGQGKYRKELVALWEGCSITGFNQIDILIASHIKPWKHSDNIERLDKFNGLLLLPTLDKLFDKGYISFDDDGKILISTELEGLEYLNIDKNMKINISIEHKVYLEFHRENVFKIFDYKK